MSNFFTDNRDLQFTLDNLDLREVLELKENGYTEKEKFDYAPENYEDAMDSFRRILTVIGDISGEKIAPRAKQVDEEGPKFENGVVTQHPLTVQNLNELKAAGVMGVTLPRQYGGLSFPNTIYTMMTELVSRADASLQNLFGLQSIAETIGDFGTPEQLQELLPDFASGKVDGAMDLTEPDAGSDLQSVRLKATQDENGNWYLDGVKRFITNGCAKVHLVLARSEEGTTDGRGLSMFICRKSDRLVVRRIEHKMGIHGVPTAELQYNHVPAELCGKRKMGLIRYVMSLMNGARVAISAQAVGIAEAAFREARLYASERQQFKQAINTFPVIYDMLARMKANVVAGRTLLYETTRMVDLRNCYMHVCNDPAKLSPENREKMKYYTEVASTLTPMSKAFATEMANSVCYDCIQIHGGTGYMHDFEAERLYRDVRITNIYEGTTQLQVVAAIGGIMKRSLDKRMEELFAEISADNEFAAPLRTILQNMYDEQHEAVKYIAEKKDPDYYNLRARNLVDNETFILVGLLMLRDALKDPDRQPLAERFILDREKDFERNCQLVLGEDHSVIERHSAVIDY